jgi:hypothetical protein
MPIRYRDQQTRLGQIAASLAGAASAITGTFVPAVGRTGIVGAQLEGASGLFQGNYSSAPNRSGVIGTSLEGATAAIVGGNGSLARAEADWLARKAGSVWAHDFRNASELTNFLWVNTDPRDSGVMPRIVADGPTGYCLEYMALGAEVVGTFGTGATALSINDATHWPSGDFYFHIAAPPGGYPAKRNNLF